MCVILWIFFLWFSNVLIFLPIFGTSYINPQNVTVFFAISRGCEFLEILILCGLVFSILIWIINKILILWFFLIFFNFQIFQTFFHDPYLFFWPSRCFLTFSVIPILSCRFILSRTFLCHLPISGTSSAVWIRFFGILKFSLGTILILKGFLRVFCIFLNLKFIFCSWILSFLIGGSMIFIKGSKKSYLKFFLPVFL